LNFIEKIAEYLIGRDVQGSLIRSALCGLLTIAVMAAILYIALFGEPLGGAAIWQMMFAN